MQTTSTDQLSLPTEFLLDQSFPPMFQDPSSAFSLAPSLYTSFDSSAMLPADLPFYDSSDNDSASSIQSPLPLTPSPLETPSHMYSISLPVQVDSPTTPLVATATTEVKKNSKRKISKEIADISAVPEKVVLELINEKALKDKRLARKAELARQSRKKKKARLTDLEQQVSELEAELARVKEEAKQLAAKNALLSAQTAKATQMPEKTAEKAIEELLSLSTLDPIQSDLTLNQLLTQISLAFQNQSASMEMSVKSLEQFIVPCLPLQFLDWTMMQKDKFFEEETSIFYELFRSVMGGTPQQLKQLLLLRKQFHMQQAKVKDQTLVESLKTLKKLLLDRGRLRQAESFEQLRSIFTPQQMAEYLKWVQQYGRVLVKVPVP